MQIHGEDGYVKTGRDWSYAPNQGIPWATRARRGKEGSSPKWLEGAWPY